MKLLLRRIAKKPTYTIGRLYVNGTYFCDTCEDKVRDLTKEKKIPGETAIPSGTYRIAMDVYSPKFGHKAFYQKYANGGKLPRLLSVPQFEGVLIHFGNTAADSAGCILVGKNKVVGQVVESQETFKALYRQMYGAVLSNDPITIEIV